MTKAETIEYAINQKCCEYPFVDYNFVKWCEDWGFTVEEFRRFLECGKEGFLKIEEEQNG